MPELGNMIRPIVICVFRQGPQILVAEGTDPATGEVFYRPLGGGIEFGESSADALRREICEELGTEIEDLKLLGVLENPFVYDDARGHEIVFVYDAAFVDRRLYDVPAPEGLESDGSVIPAIWLDLNRYVQGSPPVYPDGLIELLCRSCSMRTRS